MGTFYRHIYLCYFSGLRLYQRDRYVLDGWSSIWCCFTCMYVQSCSIYLLLLRSWTLRDDWLNWGLLIIWMLLYLLGQYTFHQAGGLLVVLREDTAVGWGSSGTKYNDMYSSYVCHRDPFSPWVRQHFFSLCCNNNQEEQLNIYGTSRGAGRLPQDSAARQHNPCASTNFTHLPLLIFLLFLFSLRDTYINRLSIVSNNCFRNCLLLLLILILCVCTAALKHHGVRK